MPAAKIAPTAATAWEFANAAAPENGRDSGGNVHDAPNLSLILSLREAF